MTHAHDEIRFERVVHRFAPQSTLLRARPLGGGVSAQVTALELRQPDGGTWNVIVRQHGPLDLARNPHIAADEFTLLRILRAAGLSTPAPYYLDQSGEILPTPYLVLQYIEGTPETAPADIPSVTRQLAMQLRSIHAIDGTRPDLRFLPRQADVYAAMLRAAPPTTDESLAEGRVRAILRAVWPLPQRNPPALLHGDFWPGNTLWRDGQLVAIIDWEDAQVGDPLADVANSRLELLWAFGIDAMERFTVEYRSIAPISFVQLPFWDLCAALRHLPKIATWGLDGATEQRMRDSLRWFITEALNRHPSP